MRSPHCISYKWAEPRSSCCAAQMGNQGIVYGVLLLTSLGWIEQKILLLEQVDYFARAKLNSNEVKKFCGKYI